MSIQPADNKPRGIELDEVVPWGRGLGEYRRMFALSERDLCQHILDVGGGPASFSADLAEIGGTPVSVDPIYVFSEQQIAQRIDETYDRVIEGTREAQEGYYWDQIKSPEELGRLRLAAMRRFLHDLPVGRHQGRYVAASLPLLPFQDNAFDLALCSHLLFSYSMVLDYETHLASIQEMLRVAREVRVFPLISVDCTPSPHLEALLRGLEAGGFAFERVPTGYRMQKGAEYFLRITRGG